MTCDAYDQLFFSGMSQPHIGTFTLKLGDVILEMMETDQEKKQNLDYILDILRKINERLMASKNNPNRKRVAELVMSIDKAKEVKRDEKKEQDMQVGENILAHLLNNDAQLPNRSSMKSKAAHKKKRAEDSPRAWGSKAQHAEKMQEILGTNVRKKVQLAFEADIAKKKKELEDMRAE